MINLDFSRAWASEELYISNPLSKRQSILDNDKLHDILLMISDKDHTQPDNKRYVFNKINDLINSEKSSPESYASRLLKNFNSINVCDINQQNDEKNSPPHFACKADDTDTIAFLLSDKRLTTLNSKNVAGETPLMTAVNLAVNL